MAKANKKQKRVRLPRDVRDLISNFQTVFALSDLKPGDLLITLEVSRVLDPQYGKNDKGIKKGVYVELVYPALGYHVIHDVPTGSGGPMAFRGHQWTMARLIPGRFINSYGALTTKRQRAEAKQKGDDLRKRRG